MARVTLIALLAITLVLVVPGVSSGAQKGVQCQGHRTIQSCIRWLVESMPPQHNPYQYFKVASPRATVKSVRPLGCIKDPKNKARQLCLFAVTITVPGGLRAVPTRLKITGVTSSGRRVSTPRILGASFGSMRQGSSTWQFKLAPKSWTKVYFVAQANRDVHRYCVSGTGQRQQKCSG